MPTMDQIKKALYSSGNGYALEMAAAMETRAEHDPAYAEKLNRWLANGGTVLLRDELCEPFRDFDLVKNLEPTLPMPWHNCWQALDSAYLHAAYDNRHAVIPNFHVGEAA